MHAPVPDGLASSGWKSLDKREPPVFRGDPPRLRKGLPDTEGRIPEAACQAARTIAADAHRIDRDWATQAIETLGDAAYVELGSIVATVAALDAFAETWAETRSPTKR